MGRSQFTFYESYYKALTRIKKKADKAEAFDAICQYALYGDVPDLDRLPDAAAIAFELIRPTLDASRKKAEGGAKSSKATPKMSDGSAKDSGGNPARYRKDIDKMSVRYQEDTDNEKEDEKEKENEYEYEGESECYSAPPAPIKPPSLEEVQEFCQAEKLNIDPSRFFHYYDGRGWLLGNQPMVNWKSVLKSWGNDKTKTGSGGTIGAWTSESMRELAQEVQRRRAQRDLDPMTKRAVERLMAGSNGQEEE